ARSSSGSSTGASTCAARSRARPSRPAGTSVSSWSRTPASTARPAPTTSSPSPSPCRPRAARSRSPSSARRRCSRTSARATGLPRMRRRATARGNVVVRTSPHTARTPMSQPSINLHGAVDLSALARPPQPAAPAGDAADAPIVVDVTEADFQQTVELSMRVPVVVEVAAAYAGGPSAVLAKVATDFGGRFQLARVDVETSPQIAQAFQVQAVPTVVAIVRGQPVPLYQGDYPEDQLRAVLEELLRVAGQAGVTGTVSGAGAEEEP